MWHQKRAYRTVVDAGAGRASAMVQQPEPSGLVVLHRTKERFSPGLVDDGCLLSRAKSSNIGTRMVPAAQTIGPGITPSSVSSKRRTLPSASCSLVLPRERAQATSSSLTSSLQLSAGRGVRSVLSPRQETVLREPALACHAQREHAKQRLEDFQRLEGLALKACQRREQPVPPTAALPWSRVGRRGRDPLQLAQRGPICPPRALVSPGLGNAAFFFESDRHRSCWLPSSRRDDARRSLDPPSAQQTRVGRCGSLLSEGALSHEVGQRLNHQHFSPSARARRHVSEQLQKRDPGRWFGLGQFKTRSSLGVWMFKTLARLEHPVFEMRELLLYPTFGRSQNFTGHDLKSFRRLDRQVVNARKRVDALLMPVASRLEHPNVKSVRSDAGALCQGTKRQSLSRRSAEKA